MVAYLGTDARKSCVRVCVRVCACVRTVCVCVCVCVCMDEPSHGCLFVAGRQLSRLFSLNHSIVIAHVISNSVLCFVLPADV